MNEIVSELTKLNDRSRTILRQIVETYLETGEPVGSRNLSRALPMTLSPASIRNVMSDLEQLGLIAAPHTSAGRLPTQLGLRLFVDGLLEIGDLTARERRQIEQHITGKRSKSIDDVLHEASELISGLSHCAGVVLAEQQVARLKHIEFVLLEPNKALVVLVGEDQTVENRIINIPAGLPPSALVEAANYLNTRVRGSTIAEARARIEAELQSSRAELDTLTQKVIQAGLAEWSGSLDDRKSSRISSKRIMPDKPSEQSKSKSPRFKTAYVKSTCTVSLVPSAWRMMLLCSKFSASSSVSWPASMS